MPSAPTASSRPAAKSRARRPLGEALHDPGFTPRRRDLSALVELLGVAEARQVRLVEAAILRIGPVVGEAVEQAFVVAKPPLRGRLMRILGRWALTCPEFVDGILRALGDADAKTQRNAIIAAGKLDDSRVAGRLLELARVEDRLPHLRSLTDALGKVGGVQGLEWLRGLDDRGDPELVRLRTKALLIAERTLARALGSGGQVDLRAQVETPIAVEFRCRAGLEDLLVDEIVALGVLKHPTVVAQGVVGGRFTGPLAELFKIRLALEVSFPLAGSGALHSPSEEVRAVIDRLADPALLERLRSWTRGAIRYRLDLAGGHRRAEVWRIAEQLRRVAPELVNDPTASTWEIRTRRVDRELVISLVPRAVEDPRFAYRCGDVPAASHPTIAAALARMVTGTGTGEQAVIWDPFVGSGLELCERGLLAPYGRLWGSDIDPRALEIASANLKSAGLDRTELLLGDACELSIAGGVSAIITNPPLGRRVHRGVAQSLLCAALPNLARNLRVGGCLVWITPEPRRTAPVAEGVGLRLERWQRIDLGGFAATVERWRRLSSGH